MVEIHYSDKALGVVGLSFSHGQSLEKFHHVQANLLINIVVGVFFILSDMCQAGLLSLLQLQGGWLFFFFLPSTPPV